MHTTRRIQGTAGARGASSAAEVLRARGASGGHRRRRRVRIGAAGVAALVAIVLTVVLWPKTSPPPVHLSTVPATVPKPQVKARLAPEARHVAARFIQTAVAREHLAEAWTLVGPNLRGGLTRKQWLTGVNPVVPYPVDSLDVAPFKVDASYVDSALLEVALLPRKGAHIRSQVFFLELRAVRRGGSTQWVVDNWVPRASAVTPR